MNAPAVITERTTLDLSSGQVPDPLAPEIREALHAAADSPWSPYAARGGEPALRAAVAAHYTGRTGRAFDAAGVVVTPGVRAGLFAAVAAVARGRDVLVPAPHWSHYPRTLELAGATMVTVPGAPADRWRLTVAALESARTPKTAAVLVTSPVNPSGAVLDRARLRAIAGWAAEHGITVLVDDVYWAWAGAEDALASVGTDAVVVGGASKVHALAGLRLGWVLAPAGLRAVVDDVVEHVTGPVNTSAQAAGMVALTEPFCSRDVAERRQRLAAASAEATAAMRGVRGVDVVPADAGLYLCLSVERLLAGATFGATDDRTLCAAIADRSGVRLRAGSTFGMPEHLRLCVAAAPGVLAAAAARLDALLPDLPR
ncbi:aminotransferase class I/II-fold pyridoxal phosphate-dependent enzyme [Pseudonocardia sp. TRM90224]|uniref:aminotransferase class I/II-fold pyridoxal phosphate-dependent enzyme n=1 Tax=Pseudonocardia sp. TRM90224 TaxID=2812678 RepID=UPI001E3FA4BF|nr:aminotransferase class I/II-fold pyridoxal phosphate-dependent enzyme [Pseudonocardia sp. TRM90224]